MISTPVGVANELVFDNKTGYLANHNPEEIAKKINLLKEQKVRNEFGNNIQKLVKAHFSWDTIIEKYNSLYLKCV